jgi:tetratricopeptide (TPR) repeat protein
VEGQPGLFEFTQAAEKDKSFGAASLNLAPMLADAGEHQRALAEYAKAVAQDPDDLVAYINRGVLQMKLEQYANAVADFDGALTIEPRCSIAWYNRGCSYHRLGKWEQACADYTQALIYSPLNARVAHNRAVACLWGADKPAEARADFVFLAEKRAREADEEAVRPAWKRGLSLDELPSQFCNTSTLDITHTPHKKQLPHSAPSAPAPDAAVAVSPFLGCERRRRRTRRSRVSCHVRTLSTRTL